MMPIDVARQNHCFVFHVDEITAALDKHDGQNGRLLRTLTNTRLARANVVI